MLVEQFIKKGLIIREAENTRVLGERVQKKSSVLYTDKQFHIDSNLIRRKILQQIARPFAVISPLKSISFRISKETWTFFFKLWLLIQIDILLLAQENNGKEMGQSRGVKTGYRRYIVWHE
jgi:hypothetical protein